MHEIRILMFLVAVVHICNSVVCLVVAQKRCLHWTKWEYWGDDQSETIAMLRPPTKYSSTAAKWATFFLKQFYNSVDPFSYILFRRYYVIKNHKNPATFNFQELVMLALQNDFKNIVGVSSWMWLIIVLQILAEGYQFGKYHVILVVTWNEVAGLVPVGAKDAVSLACNLAAALLGPSSGPARQGVEADAASAARGAGVDSVKARLVLRARVRESRRGAGDQHARAEGVISGTHDAGEALVAARAAGIRAVGASEVGAQARDARPNDRSGHGRRRACCWSHGSKQGQVGSGRACGWSHGLDHTRGRPARWRRRL